jgi:hypothetical protein
MFPWFFEDRSDVEPSSSRLSARRARDRIAVSQQAPYHGTSVFSIRYIRVLTPTPRAVGSAGEELHSIQVATSWPMKADDEQASSADSAASRRLETEDPHERLVSAASPEHLRGEMTGAANVAVTKAQQDFAITKSRPKMSP